MCSARMVSLDLPDIVSPCAIVTFLEGNFISGVHIDMTHVPRCSPWSITCDMHFLRPYCLAVSFTMEVIALAPAAGTLEKHSCVHLCDLEFAYRFL